MKYQVILTNDLKGIIETRLESNSKVECINYIRTNKVTEGYYTLMEKIGNTSCYSSIAID